MMSDEWQGVRQASTSSNSMAKTGSNQEAGHASNQGAGLPPNKTAFNQGAGHTGPHSATGTTPLAVTTLAAASGDEGGGDGGGGDDTRSRRRGLEVRTVALAARLMASLRSSPSFPFPKPLNSNSFLLLPAQWPAKVNVKFG